MKVALAFARVPAPGRVKTRLAKALGDEEACRIYRLLARGVHTALCEQRSADATRVHVCLPDEDLTADDPTWLPGADARWGQGPGDLGSRMARCISRAFEEGAERVLIVGTDIVGLSADVLTEAFAALDTHDVAVSPTPDGGYGLLAVSRQGWQSGGALLFADVVWSSPAVMRQTRQRASDAGLDLRALPALRDVDEAPDLVGVVPMLSILIPTYNEAERLPALLESLQSQFGAQLESVEVLVADGGSTDDTARVARAQGVRVLEAPPGRGAQLAAAAQAARGRWLWTLHADAGVAPDAIARVLDYCQRAPRPWACCHARFDTESFAMRFIDCMADGRARLLQRPYGDQGLLVTRSLYEQTGGYEEVPLMEDLRLAAACARARGGPGRVETTLLVDGRRFRHHGWMGTIIRDLMTVFRFGVLGTKSERLARDYYRGTERGVARRGALLLLAAVIVLAVGAFAFFGGDAEQGSVSVRVLDGAGKPIGGAHVAWRGQKILRTTNTDGYARLPWTDALGTPTPNADVALREFQAGGKRHAPHPDHQPRIVRNGKGQWHIEARLVTFGRITLRVDATVLPNVRARVASDGPGRIEAEDGVAVARVGQDATWRVFPPTKRIVITVEGDMGSAMQRFSLPAPSIGYRQQETIEALSSAAIAVLTTPPGGFEPPASSGLVLLVEDERSADAPAGSAPSGALEGGDGRRALPLHPVRMPATGHTIVPHSAKRPYRILMLWDFMGPTPATTSDGGGTAELPPPAPAAWCRIHAPDDAPAAKQMHFRASESGVARPAPVVPDDIPPEWRKLLIKRARTPRIVHHDEQPYLVSESLGTWTLNAWRTGSDEAPPWRGRATVTIGAFGEHEIALEGEQEPWGTLVIAVPEALRSAAEVTLPGDRRTTLLRVTKELRVPHLRAGAVTVRITWRDETLPPLEHTVEIKAGEETRWTLAAVVAAGNADVSVGN